MSMDNKEYKKTIVAIICGAIVSVAASLCSSYVSYIGIKNIKEQSFIEEKLNRSSKFYLDKINTCFDILNLIDMRIFLGTVVSDSSKDIDILVSDWSIKLRNKNSILETIGDKSQIAIVTKINSVLSKIMRSIESDFISMQDMRNNNNIKKEVYKKNSSSISTVMLYAYEEDLKNIYKELQKTIQNDYYKMITVSAPTIGN